MLVAGFDEAGKAEIMSAANLSHGIPNREIGYGAIGNGAPNALTFLSWRETNQNTPIRGALAHAVEAKLQGELAPDNSEETQAKIMRFGKEDIVIPEKIIEDVLMQKIAIPNRPPNIKMDQLKLLNKIDVLNKENLPYVWADDERQLIEKTYEKDRAPEVSPRKGKSVKKASGAKIIGTTTSLHVSSFEITHPRTKRDR